VSTKNRPTLNGAMSKTLARITRAAAGVPCSRLDARHVNHLHRRGLIRLEAVQIVGGLTLVEYTDHIAFAA
jgi:hypothetical protein